MEAAGRLAAGADRARPGHHGDARAARHWMGRRADCVQLILATIVSMFSDLYGGIPLWVGAFRDHCGSACVLVDFRPTLSRHLQSVFMPVGFYRIQPHAGWCTFSGFALEYGNPAPMTDRMTSDEQQRQDVALVRYGPKTLSSQRGRHPATAAWCRTRCPDPGQGRR